MNIGSMANRAKDFPWMAAQLSGRKVLYEYMDDGSGNQKVRQIYDVDGTFPYIFTAHRKAKNGHIIRTSFMYSQVMCGEVRILKD